MLDLWRFIFSETHIWLGTVVLVHVFGASLRGMFRRDPE